MSEEQESRELAAETYSHSSEEAEDELDDEELEESEDSAPFWREHWVAIVMALLATVVVHFYNNPDSFQDSGLPALLPFLEESTSPHNYLDHHKRMANISFCPRTSRGDATKSLASMDFFIPKEFFQTLQIYYHADEAQDDFYRLADEEYEGITLHNGQYQCLLQQELNVQAPKFRGTTYFYPQPTLSQIYPNDEDASRVAGVIARNADRRKKKLQQPAAEYTGFGAKFVNLSPKPVLLFWDGKGGREDTKKLVGEIAPFESLGTATTPGHGFHVTRTYDASWAMQRWVLTADTALVYFEPHSPQEIHDMLLARSDKEPDFEAWAKYQRQLVNQAFARDYLASSQRSWLSNFPRRFPMHFMHSADYIGQQHVMGKYTLNVVSVAPRVMVIDNFLTPEECYTLIETSQEQGLKMSTMHSGATATQIRDLSTRSSSNTWLPRDISDLTNQVYEQAAEVMGISSEHFQKFHHSDASHHSIAESMQVVRYKAGGEEYQPHHDFFYPQINDRHQPSRFATLLVYLNDVPEGGETRFPLALNKANAKGLEVKPKVGQAVLFYSMLPDGNVDDMSLHGSNPTGDHDKWLANIWVWDPVMG
eukprot:Nitzschia sp. Nitz4//scaffold6_size259037//149610//151475//NITZ4_001086-RA/size259037-augustus-gene-0.322-mRNA-1//-1//CDS//3329556929//1876//frame0